MTEKITATGPVNDSTPPTQIPLLEDLALETRRIPAVSAKPKVSTRTDITLNKPISTDLFPEIVVLSSKNSNSEPVRQTEAVEMTDNLARIYSLEVIQKLRDELTLLLNDLSTPTPEIDSNKDHKPSV
jgi:hypothetical protein